MTKIIISDKRILADKHQMEIGKVSKFLMGKDGILKTGVAVPAT